MPDPHDPGQDCSNADRNPEEYCPSMPWCDSCSTTLPGGGGLVRLLPRYGEREIRVSDHGQFAPWMSGNKILAAFVIAIPEDASPTNLTFKIIDTNGHEWVEHLPVSRTEEEWDTYLGSRKKYAELRHSARERARVDFLAAGHSFETTKHEVWEQFVAPYLAESKAEISAYRGGGYSS